MIDVIICYVIADRVVRAFNGSVVADVLATQYPLIIIKCDVDVGADRVKQYRDCWCLGDARSQGLGLEPIYRDHN